MLNIQGLLNQSLTTWERQFLEGLAGRAITEITQEQVDMWFEIYRKYNDVTH